MFQGENDQLADEEPLFWFLQGVKGLSMTCTDVCTWAACAECLEMNPGFSQLGN